MEKTRQISKGKALEQRQETSKFSSSIYKQTLHKYNFETTPYIIMSECLRRELKTKLAILQFKLCFLPPNVLSQSKI